MHHIDPMLPTVVADLMAAPKSKQACAVKSLQAHWAFRPFTGTFEVYSPLNGLENPCHVVIIPLCNSHHVEDKPFRLIGDGHRLSAVDASDLLLDFSSSSIV